MVRGMQLQPKKASVSVGQSAALKIVACARPDPDPADPDGVLPMPGGRYECGYTFQGLSAEHWAVNGEDGGSSSLGTMQATGARADGTASYTAPTRIPGRNPVAVSVNVSEVFGRRGVQTLVSNLTVEDSQNWQGTVTYTETGSTPWVMRDGFEGAGLDHARQTHTFKVVGVKNADAQDTTLLLEQEAFAEYTDRGHMEKKIYEICQAFGPTILRHHFVYDRNLSMGGTVKVPLEARLNIADGRYSLAINPEAVPMTGQDVTTDIYKDGCAETTNDRSNSRPVRSSAGPQSLQVKGAVDPAHPTTLTGGYTGKGQIFVQPTRYQVSWNLTRGR